MRKFNRQGQSRFVQKEFRQMQFFGGSYCTQRRFRVARPLSTKHPIHLVLRSSKAVGGRSFLKKSHRRGISCLLIKLGQKWGVQVQNFANVGNHLHLQIRLGNRRTYKPFICALTGGIATIVTRGEKLTGKFWDHRPFSRIVYGRNAILSMRDYLLINKLEGGGSDRNFAICLVRSGAITDSG